MSKQIKKQEEKIGGELHGTIDSLREEISKLAMTHAKRQLKQTSLLHVKRDELARLLTKMRLQQIFEKNNKKEEAK